MAHTILTTAEAAEVLRIPAGTLRYWRHQGTGPKSFKLGQKCRVHARRRRGMAQGAVRGR